MRIKTSIIQVYKAIFSNLKCNSLRLAKQTFHYLVSLGISITKPSRFPHMRITNLAVNRRVGGWVVPLARKSIQ